MNARSTRTLSIALVVALAIAACVSPLLAAHEVMPNTISSPTTAAADHPLSRGAEVVSTRSSFELALVVVASVLAVFSASGRVMSVVRTARGSASHASFITPLRI